MVDGVQIAVFRTKEGVYALHNYDPFSEAHVLSRGIVGDKNGALKVVQRLQIEDKKCTSSFRTFRGGLGVLLTRVSFGTVRYKTYKPCHFSSPSCPLDKVGDNKFFCNH